MSSYLSKLFSSKSKPASSSSPSSEDGSDADEQLKQFIKQSPESMYTFDGTSDSRRTELCREGTNGEGNRKCIEVAMQSKRLFEAMQENGFFCALPVDPSRTNMECTPLPKS